MKKRLVAVAAATLVMLAAVLARAEEFSFQVIVNEANAVSSLDKDEVGKLFLKKTTRWESGSAAQPVDQLKSAKVREDFSTKILGKSLAAVDSLWRQKIFSGAAVPPLEKGSDEEVVAFVKANVGAIGYVSKGAGLSGVKSITVK